MTTVLAAICGVLSLAAFVAAARVLREVREETRR